MSNTRYTIAAEDDGIRLDRWFKRHHPHITHGLLQKLLRKGEVRLEGKKAESSARIATGQVVEWRNAEKLKSLIPLPEVRRDKHKADPERVKRLQARVLYKDDNVLVLNKPEGLAVQGGTGQSTSVDAMLDGLQFDAPARPKLVHRLDKDTSGVLVLARHSKAAAELAKAFAGKDIQKIYWALVVGAPQPVEGEIDAPLRKVEQGRHSRMDIAEEKMAVDEAGQRAITQYRTLERLGDRLAWLELMPITGRTHQLRVHMAAMEHPIVGDGKYGGREAFIRGMTLSPKLHLHARRIVIPNILGKKIDVTAPLPLHMQESFDALGLEV